MLTKLPAACIFLLFYVGSFAQNYDEAKVGTYTLPAVLKTNGGKKITSPKQWEKERRPEILRLFQENIYGQMPGRYDSIRYTITRTDNTAMEGRALLQQIRIDVYNKGKRLPIELVLFTPANAKKPVPCFVLINNRGKENTDPLREAKSEFWPAEMVIENGYAVAAFHVSDAAPDDKVKYKEGMLQLYPEQIDQPNGTRAIGAWAWAASRVLDYLQTNTSIDSKQVAVVGHSRGGKASLWAAACDQRFAMCISNCSGNSGLALSRRNYGETVTRINTSFPHWFNENYKKFNDNESALPVDQHMLVALVAPRPLYATNASKDLWADPVGTFLSLKHAEEVYKLYGLPSALPAAPPAIEQPITSGPLGYHNREGEHNMTVYDWQQFIRFADNHFKK